MQEKKFVVPKLSVFGVISEAVKLYKDNYKLFIKISFFAFLLNFANDTLDVAQYLFKDTPAVALYKLLLFVAVFPFLYFSIKLSIATYVCAMERYRERNIDIRSALSIAREKFWRYIGVCIELCLILLIPIAGGICSFFLIKDLLIKWLVIGIFAIPSVYIGTNYGFAPFMVIFEKGKKHPFSVSKKLVEGDFWGVVFLIFLVIVVSSAPYYLYMYVFNDYKAITEVNKYLISSLNQMIRVFITPFASSIYAVMYYKLKGNKRIG